MGSYSYYTLARVELLKSCLRKMLFTLQEISDRTRAVSEDLVKALPGLDRPHNTQPHLGLFGLVA